MEIWKEIEYPFKGIRISSFGRIRLLPSKFHYEGKITTGSADTCGYKVATVSGPDGIKKSFKVHRLVAIAFIENPNNFPQVNHLDGNKTNNKIENLEWCTASENQLHAIKIGLRIKNPWNKENINRAARGSRHGNASLTEKDVLEIRSLRSSGISPQKLAEKYGVRRCAIWMIVTKKYWTHI